MVIEEVLSNENTSTASCSPAFYEPLLRDLINVCQVASQLEVNQDVVRYACDLQKGSSLTIAVLVYIIVPSSSLIQDYFTVLNYWAVHFSVIISILLTSLPWQRKMAIEYQLTEVRKVQHIHH